MCVIRENDDGKSKIMTIAETGLGRRSETEEYRVQTRAGKGVLNYHIEKYGLVAAVDMVNDDDDVILIASNGIIIRIAAEQINAVSRTSKGVRVMRIGEEDKVVSAIAVQKEEADEDSAEENAEGEGTEAAEEASEE